MNDSMLLILALFAGFAFGAFFFGGLLWTVQRGLVSEHPAFLFLGSLLLRSAVTVFGFYFVSAGQWQRMLSCLFGFILARWLVTRVRYAS